MNLPDLSVSSSQHDTPQPGSANFSDALAGMGFKFQTMHHSIAPIAPLAEAVIAPAYPVRCYAGATWALEEAIEVAPEGSILVVDGGGFTDSVLMGGLMSMRARMRGLSGAVIDGAVRDIADIRKAGWPIFASSITPRAGTHDRNGQHDVLISCGGVPVEPAAMIVADEDGVVVVPKDLWPTAVIAAESVWRKEQFLEAKLSDGLSLKEAVAAFQDLTSEKEAVRQVSAT